MGTVCRSVLILYPFDRVHYAEALAELQGVPSQADGGRYDVNLYTHEVTRKCPNRRYSRTS